MGLGSVMGVRHRDGLGHERQRAMAVWFFLRKNHGSWFTAGEIAGATGMAESTVRNALSRIFGLPSVSRPRLQRRTITDEKGSRTEHRFARIIDIVFEE